MTKPSETAVLDLTEAGKLDFVTTESPPSALDLGEDERDDIQDDDDTAGLLGGGRKTQAASSYNFWSLSFYSRFFDVDTEDVGRRLLWSVWPRPSATSEFLRRQIRPKPDLYGPFWVCVTLVFSVAISGNVANYLQTALDTSGERYRWHYDFHKVTLAASAVFGYAWLVPAAIYAALCSTRSGGGDAEGGQASFLELLCVYGYSLAIYIPISVLWTIQISAFQWCLVLAGAGLSGGVLVLALWPSLIKEGPAKTLGCVLLAGAIVLHLLLALGFMLYFFHVPATASGTVGPDGALNATTVLPAKLDGGEESEVQDGKKVDEEATHGKTAREAEENKDNDDTKHEPPPEESQEKKDTNPGNDGKGAETKSGEAISKEVNAAP